MEEVAGLRGNGEIMKNQIRVLSVDDHPLMLEGIARVINSQPDMQVVAQACSGQEAIRSFQEHKPDITLMDLRLPDMSGIDAMIALRTQSHDARIIMLTMFDCDAEIKRALAAGARSYILKAMAPKEMAQIIRRVYEGHQHIPPEVAVHLAEHMGEEPLTDREVEILRLAMTGNCNRDIGHSLLISEETVKAHIRHAMQKLGALCRTQAVTIAAKRGMIQI